MFIDVYACVPALSLVLKGILKQKCTCSTTVTNKSCMKNVKDGIIYQSVLLCIIRYIFFSFCRPSMTFLF